jgi:hypothetical protein
MTLRRGWPPDRPVAARFIGKLALPLSMRGGLCLICHGWYKPRQQNPETLLPSAEPQARMAKAAGHDKRFPTEDRYMLKLSKVSAGSALLLALAASGGAYALTVPNFSPTSGQPSVSAPGYPDFWSLDYSAALTTTKATKTTAAYDTLSILGNNPNVLGSNGVATIFNFQNASYYVSNETLSITAKFSTTGVFESGTLSVQGSLNPWKSPTLGTSPAGYQNALVSPTCTKNCTTWQNTSIPTTTLFSATLTNVGVDTKDEALGFSIDNFGGWADQKTFTNGGVESLWLFALCSNQPNCGFFGSKAASSSMSSYGWSDGGGNSAWNTFLADIKGHSTLVANTFYDISSITTVPLPGAALLLFSGLGGLGMFRRRRSATLPAAAAA